MNKFLLILGLISAMATTAAAQILERVAGQIGAGVGSSPTQFKVAGNKLYFVALEGNNSAGLYVTTGTPASTIKVSPPGIVGASFSNLVDFNNQLYFTCDDAVHGRELWRSNGELGDATLVTDLYPGLTGSNPFGFTVVGNKLFFLARTAAGTGRLFVSDGTENGTQLVRNLPCYLPDYLGGFAVLNNEIYFKDENATNLWKSDGTPQGTVLVKAGITPMCPGGKYAVLAGKLYFTGNDATNSAEPYITDGTEAGTHLIKNIYPDQPTIKYGSTPGNFTVYNSRVYFSATDDTHGEELFATDGTEAGTFLVKDITAGTVGSRPTQLIVYNGLLYISCLQSKQLWQSDGTTLGTSLVSILTEAWYFGAIWNNEIYATNGGVSSTLYKTGGTPTTTRQATAENVSPLNAIITYGTSGYLPVYDGNLYFGGTCTGISDYREPLRLRSTAVNHSFYFTGSGNWSDPANWTGGNTAPSILHSGDSVFINQNCILDISVTAQPGSTLTIAAGKNLIVQGELRIQ